MSKRSINFYRYREIESLGIWKESARVPLSLSLVPHQPPSHQPPFRLPNLHSPTNPIPSSPLPENPTTDSCRPLQHLIPTARLPSIIGEYGPLSSQLVHSASGRRRRAR